MAFYCNNYFTIILIITIFCTICQGKPPSKIVGGTDASISDWPSIVSLRLYNKHFCGGSLITKCHVLTAAHCVFNINISGMKIATGSADQETFKHLYNLKKVDIHPKYVGKPNTNLDDIAVITLATCIVEDSTQRAVELYKRPLGNGVRGTVIGWGQLHNDIHLTSRYLQQIDSWTIMNHECSKPYGPSVIRPSQVCTVNIPGTGFCSGDSGGPFYVNHQVAGIVSMGAICGGGIPDIYTRVFDYMSWIQSKIH